MPKLTQSDLNQFTGTEEWHRHSLNRRALYTDGVKYLANKAGAYWLIDEIAILQAHAKVRGEEFQKWTLRKTVGNQARLECEDGGKDGHRSKVVFSKHIPYTDFPMDSVEIWVEGPAEQRVILLPSEH